MHTTKQKILDFVVRNNGANTAALQKELHMSRQYLNRFLQQLTEEGLIVLLGKANQARYIIAEKKDLLREKKRLRVFHRFLINKNLSEDIVLDQAKRESGVLLDVPEHVRQMVEYGFTEMLNNAIEHSQSRKIEVLIKRTDSFVRFDVIDFGVGIFKNIMEKKKLKSELEAIQNLLKGKETTDPAHHTGEGIFFTSKIADAFTIRSSTKKLIFNNNVDDIFLNDARSIMGTRVAFVVSLNSKRWLETVFKEYTSSSYEFDKTKVAVRLYKMGTLYVSRSQARRIMVGMEKFRTVVLDFRHIKSIGQGFADEIFRIWREHHPGITIETNNTNENVAFMIDRARGK